MNYKKHKKDFPGRLITSGCGSLTENLSSLVEAVVRARPSGVKGQYIKTASLTSTMGPSVPMDAIDLTELQTE